MGISYGCFHHKKASVHVPGEYAHARACVCVYACPWRKSVCAHGEGVCVKEST